MEVKLHSNTTAKQSCSKDVVEIEEGDQPVSPSGQYFNSSVLSVSIIAVLDFDIPIDNFPILRVLDDLFLPINPRFSSIMIVDKEGVKKWKKVHVNLEDHVFIPTFPPNLSSYDNHLQNYLTKIAMERFPQNRPLWEIHLIKYTTSNGRGHFIFKLHHALGDGYSLMGALLSCLQRADNSPLPLTFPTFSAGSKLGINNNIGGKIKRMISMVPKFVFGAYYSISDLGWSILKSTVVEDDKTSVRSGDEDVEFRPIEITTLIFGLEGIKQIKSKLGVTINDVITGIIFLGTRMYMHGRDKKSSSTISAETTALVLLNTRNIGGYKSVEEMVKTSDNHMQQWGNQFAFLHASVPEMPITEDDDEELLNDPLTFIFKAREMIKRKRNSLAVHLTGHILEALRKYKGPEVTAKHIHRTLRNSSMTISNLIGPVEQMAVHNHPVRGLYFMVVGVPQSLTITVMSYAQNLRIAVGAEKGFIDLKKFHSCVNTAYQLMFAAANNILASM